MFANERSLLERDIRDSASPSVLRRALRRSVAQTQREDLGKHASVESTALSREQRLRRAVLLSFGDPLPAQCLELHDITEREWRNLTHWLDVSGLALYFLDRLIELQLTHILPGHVLARLWQNMGDNTERTHGMITESLAIQRGFQEAALSYAVLKGFSLSPESVSRPELRHQFDLDFLIAEEAIIEARRVLGRLGYRLYAVSGRSWEFKKEEKIGISMKDFYKDTCGRTVELHLNAPMPGGASILDRVEKRQLNGIDMPVLSRADLFLGQGMHAYKHICGEFLRTAHLLEFYRHVLMRRQDEMFWVELRSRAEDNLKASLGLGIVTLLITSIMGEFAPPAFTEWTVDRLTPSVRLWVRLHGRRAVFGNVPGSKLYLLLQSEVEPSGRATRRSLWKALLPHRLPPEVVQAVNGESLSIRVRRYRMQLKYVLLRLRFHIVEGIRYGWEAYRWRRHMDRLTG